MKHRAIGLVEVNSVAKGLECADAMLKAADVDLIMANLEIQLCVIAYKNQYRFEHSILQVLNEIWLKTSHTSP